MMRPGENKSVTHNASVSPLLSRHTYNWEGVTSHRRKKRQIGELTLVVDEDMRRWLGLLRYLAKLSTRAPSGYHIVIQRRVALPEPYGRISISLHTAHTPF